MLKNIKSFFKKLEKRRLVFSAIFGFFLSIFLVIGKQMNDDGAITFGFTTPLNLMIVFILLTAVTYYLISKIKYKNGKKFDLKRWQIFLPLAIVSVFILFAVYPGNYNIDIAWQWAAYKTGNLGTHYPIFYNFIFCSLMEFLYNIFHSWEFTIFILNLIQTLLVNFVVMEIVMFFGKRIKSKKFTIIAMLFYLTNPLYQCLIISTGHDIGFSAIFALIIIETIKMVEEKEYFLKKKNWAKFIILVFVLCIFRNNGSFAIIPALILGLFVIGKGKRLKLTAIVMIPILLFTGYNQFIVNNVVKEKESVLRESLNIPVNQLARALYYNHPSVWSEELELYFEPECNWALYGKWPAISDFQKTCLKTDYIESHLTDFVAYWAKIGLKVPHRYIEAPFLFDLGAYYPFIDYATEPDTDATRHGYVQYGVHIKKYLGEYIEIYRYPNIPVVDKIMEQLIVYQKWNKIAFFRVIWGGAFTTILLLFTACYVGWKKQKQYFVPLAFIFGMLLTVLLSPVILYRYMFPIVLCIPAMFYIILKCVNEKVR
ncbi:hypothetical protein IJ768_02950 [Candidatus Saccharibacteria bacterium]|nr:hypothetical protein [Candidatus Saccharibacteria bacterium]